MEKVENMDYISMIGNNLRRIRKEKKLSIFTASLELQMSHHHLGDIERGQTNPQIKTLARLTDYYGIHMKELFE